MTTYAPSKTLISVLGLGRVGLVTAVCFARRGYKVVGIDTDRTRLNKIRNGEPIFFEPKLHQYTNAVTSNHKLTVTDDSLANANADLAYITVGTPSNIDGSIDLDYVKSAAGSIGRSLRKSSAYQIIVIKSTVAPGTARDIIKPILERETGKTAGQGYGVCSNPEFLGESSAIHDAEYPDRIVLGSDDTKTLKKVEAFYRQVHRKHVPPILRTTHENAELIKYANNAFLATKISFINNIANITERIPGADVKQIAAGLGLDDRIGARFLNAGLGWGGSCFPKDLNALRAYSRKLGYNSDLIDAAVRVNDHQKQRAVEIAKQELGSLSGKNVAILGLSFKPGTDDMREAVSVPIVESLLAEGATVAVYDPAAIQNAHKIFGDRVRYAKDEADCISQADCSITVTEWPDFNLPPSKFLKLMRHPIVIDGRRIYDADQFIRAGVDFFAIGLGPTKRH
jgi:UDPglucose 6-dehydrogenase